MPTTNENTDPASGARKVLIVYESVPARERAAFFCGGFFSENSHAAVHWCATQQLNDRNYADEMFDHAMSADVVILAGSAEGELSPETKLWINRWLSKRTREGALVGLFGNRPAQPGELTSLKEIYLRHAAHQAGMDYLSQLPSGSRRTIPDSLDTCGQRAGQVTSVLHDILQKPIPPPPPL